MSFVKVSSVFHCRVPATHQCSIICILSTVTWMAKDINFLPMDLQLVLHDCFAIWFQYDIHRSGHREDLANELFTKYRINHRVLSFPLDVGYMNALELIQIVWILRTLFIGCTAYTKLSDRLSWTAPDKFSVILVGEVPMTRLTLVVYISSSSVMRLYQ